VASGLCVHHCMYASELGGEWFLCLNMLPFFLVLAGLKSLDWQKKYNLCVVQYCSSNSSMEGWSRWWCLQVGQATTFGIVFCWTIQPRSNVCLPWLVLVRLVYDQKLRRSSDPFRHCKQRTGGIRIPCPARRVQDLHCSCTGTASATAHTQIGRGALYVRGRAKQVRARLPHFLFC
jgi:hypothetical protein